MVMQKRIMLMYYVNLYTFLEDPEKDWAKLLSEANPPPEGGATALLLRGAYFQENHLQCRYNMDISPLTDF